jgi:hypothetical protein
MQETPKPETHDVEPDNDLDEETSWQAMARASLKDEKRGITQSGDQKAKDSSASQAPSFKESNKSATPSQFQPPAPEFVQEELPADFWQQEAIPVEIYDDEASFESSLPASPKPKNKNPDSSPIKHPLFAELQSLFPGKIVRIEITKAEPKTGDDSKDEPEPTILAEQSLEEPEAEGE